MIITTRNIVERIIIDNDYKNCYTLYCCLPLYFCRFVSELQFIVNESPSHQRCEICDTLQNRCTSKAETYSVMRKGVILHWYKLTERLRTYFPLWY